MVFFEEEKMTEKRVGYFYARDSYGVKNWTVTFDNLLGNVFCFFSRRFAFDEFV